MLVPRVPCSPSHIADACILQCRIWINFATHFKTRESLGVWSTSLCLRYISYHLIITFLWFQARCAWSCALSTLVSSTATAWMCFLVLILSLLLWQSYQSEGHNWLVCLVSAVTSILIWIFARGSHNAEAKNTILAVVHGTMYWNNIDQLSIVKSCIFLVQTVQGWFHAVWCTAPCCIRVTVALV